MIEDELNVQYPNPEERTLIRRLVGLVKYICPCAMDTKTGVAIMSILTNRTIEFSDGVVINDPTKAGSYDIGFGDAAIIVCLVASLHDSKPKDWLWWKVTFPAYDQVSEGFLLERSTLESKIRDFKDITRFED